ncbi:hypothetical protein [Actinokineospora enzanensis]|nr:hypothetical protein [Actinokineospora enzanensis]
MIEAILYWTGLVLAFTLLLMMALGPVIVEWDDRHRARHREAGAARADS